MKILLDEQLPVKLKYRFNPELYVSTVKDEQWLGVKNGVLLQLALSNEFSVFITNDHNISHQQSLSQFKMLFININQPFNRYEDVLPAILIIKAWLIKNKEDVALIIAERNYVIYPEDFAVQP
ncbi:MAG TPA: hypothetical protein VFW07_09515 [Parafilimonas sp.]|nr:hypothetical protein [Parafilimonas sp.]